jgi:hypothetical protein
LWEWQEVQELLRNPLSPWKRNHLTTQIAEPKADLRVELGTLKSDYSHACWTLRPKYDSSRFY